MGEIEWKAANEWVSNIVEYLGMIDSSVGSVDESIKDVGRKLDEMISVLKRIEAKS
jgi:archaellum component FlaC